MQTVYVVSTYYTTAYTPAFTPIAVYQSLDDAEAASRAADDRDRAIRGAIHPVSFYPEHSDEEPTDAD